MVGADQIPAPAGPNIGVPSELVLYCFGGSLTVFVCHTTLPVAASSAFMLPWNEQHRYFGVDDDISSSPDASGTNSRPLKNTGAPVILAATCWSSFVFHSGAPVCASTACATPDPSPNIATHLDPTFTMLTAVRMIVPAS